MKQSYTGGATCAYPYGYVEPLPSFYRAVGRFAYSAQQKLSAAALGSSVSWLGDYFDRVARCMDTLATISEKELAKSELSAGESRFLRQLIKRNDMCGPVYDGWYPRLYFQWDDCDTANFVIADVHTAPTDEFGNMVGKVFHAATGPVNLGIVIAAACPGDTIAFIGPLMSYYEYVTLNFDRLTDEEWKLMIDGSPPPRPSWVNVYLADSLGVRRAPGPMLFTGVEPPGRKPAIPRQYALGQNFPNPFNGSTLIGFSVPAGASSPVEILIYDVTGRRVRSLYRNDLPGGSYFVRWDGTADGSKECASGVYFYTLRGGDFPVTKSMLLLR